MVGGGGGLEQFSVSPRPLGFGFGTLGLRVWGQGLTIVRFWAEASSVLLTNLLGTDKVEDK